MTKLDLKQVILDYFRTTYEVEFIGNMKIEDLVPVGYKVSLYLDNDYYPLVIMADLPDDEFVKYLKEELRSRKLHKTKYFTTIKIQNANIFRGCDIEPIDTNIFRVRIPKYEYGVVDHIKDDSYDKYWVGTQKEFDKLSQIYADIEYYVYELI